MIKIGISDQDGFMAPNMVVRRRLLERAADAGLDHITVGDHVSFHGGTGFDGLISATSILTSQERLSVIVGVYLLGLRHPMLAARQLSTLSGMSPGRLTLGVGVGGEDRLEVSNSGVDPVSRGRRLDESLAVLRALLSQKDVNHDGEFFHLESASILPTPQPQIPIVIGGKGDVAIRRTAQFGDGWLGIFCSARRFLLTYQQILVEASEYKRPSPHWFGVNVWCGLDSDENQARQLIGARMESLYRLPYEQFQFLAPHGPPHRIAEFLSEFVTAGAEHVTLVPAARSLESAIDMTAEIGEELRRFA